MVVGANGYRLSFTTGGLLCDEAVAVAAVMVVEPDVSEVRTTAVERNLVQQRTSASTTRVTREVIGRLAGLPPAGIELVANGSAVDARALMWLAACLRYRLVGDFGRDVVRERLLSGRLLVAEDFDTFWNQQASWIDALRDAADTTRKKLRQNTFRMIREAGWLTGDGHVREAALSFAAIEVIRDVNPELALSFPLHNAQVAGIIQHQER